MTMPAMGTIMLSEEDREMVEKNKKKQVAKENRVRAYFNTGTRTHKNKKAYKREKRWLDKE